MYDHYYHQVSFLHPCDSTVAISSKSDAPVALRTHSADLSHVIINNKLVTEKELEQTFAIYIYTCK